LRWVAVDDQVDEPADECLGGHPTAPTSATSAPEAFVHGITLRGNQGRLRCRPRGADHRSPRTGTRRCINRAKRTIPGRDHTRRPGMRWGDCQLSKQLRLLQTFRPLTCPFAPPAGLEPATYGLEVDLRPSTSCRSVRFWLVRSGAPSRRCGPVALSEAWRNDRRNDQRPSCSGIVTSRRSLIEADGEVGLAEARPS
jgi:hypothetical protein